MSADTAAVPGGEMQDAPTLPIAVLGRSEFTLGFELVGVHTVIATDGLSPGERTKRLFETMQRRDIGILIVEDETMDAIPTTERVQVENAIRPVVIVLTEHGHAGGTLQRQIKRAIGIDIGLSEDNEGGSGAPNE